MAWPPQPNQQVFTDITNLYPALNPIHDRVLVPRNQMNTTYSYDSQYDTKFIPSTLFEFHPAQYVNHWLVDYWRAANVNPPTAAGAGRQYRDNWYANNPLGPAPVLLPAMVTALPASIRPPASQALHVESESDAIRAAHQSFIGWVEAIVNQYYRQYGINIYSRAEVAVGVGRADLVWYMARQGPIGPLNHPILILEFKQPGALHKADNGTTPHMGQLCYIPQGLYTYGYAEWQQWKRDPKTVTNIRFSQAMTDRMNIFPLANNTNSSGSILRQIGYYSTQLQRVKRILICDYRKMALVEYAKPGPSYHEDQLKGKGFSIVEDETGTVTFAMMLLATLVAAVAEDL